MPDRYVCVRPMACILCNKACNVVAVALVGEVTEGIISESKEWINVTDLVPAGMGTGSQSCQKCGAGGLHLQPNCVVCRTALTKLS